MVKHPLEFVFGGVASCLQLENQDFRAEPWCLNVPPDHPRGLFISCVVFGIQLNPVLLSLTDLNVTWSQSIFTLLILILRAAASEMRK